MMKTLPLIAAAAALCACTSPPKIQFPTGTGQRTPVLGIERAPDSPYWAAEKPPEPSPLRRFHVEAGEDSLMAVAAQWARTGGLPIFWQSTTDYPINRRLRDIREDTLDAALERVRTALAGARKPLVFAREAGALVVRDAEAAQSSSAQPSASGDPLTPPGAPRRASTLELQSDALFGFGSPQPTRDGLEAVRHIARKIREAGSRHLVVVVGHTDRLGADDANLLLSVRRASIVRNLLRPELPGTEIVAEGRAAREPVADCPGAASEAVIACLAPNRRVSIHAVTLTPSY